MVEWERGTVVDAGQLRLVMQKLHRLLEDGRPFQLTINSDGKKIGPVKCLVTLMDGEDDYCEVVSLTSSHGKC